MNSPPKRLRTTLPGISGSRIGEPSAFVPPIRVTNIFCPVRMYIPSGSPGLKIIVVSFLLVEQAAASFKPISGRIRGNFQMA